MAIIKINRSPQIYRTLGYNIRQYITENAQHGLLYISQ